MNGLTRFGAVVLLCFIVLFCAPGKVQAQTQICGGGTASGGGQEHHTEYCWQGFLSIDDYLSFLAGQGSDGGDPYPGDEVISAPSPSMNYLDLDCSIDIELRAAYAMEAIQHSEAAMGVLGVGTTVEVSYYTGGYWTGTEQFVILWDSDSEAGLSIASWNGCQVRPGW